MSYQEYTEIASLHLRKIGVEPDISSGSPLTEKDLESAEDEMGVSLPAELREYLMEMGDGFQFGYSAEDITGNGDDFFFWGIDSLRDIVSDYQSMREEMERNAGGEGDYCDSEECKEESRRRMNWVPVSGIGGGGYTLCVDANEGRGDIRFHDIRMGDDHFPSIRLASSIHDWMAKWCRFCFSQPLWDGTDKHAELVSYCWEKDGTFDWDPSKFRTNFHIEKIM